MKVLVCGGTGFVGRHVVRRLLADGQDVIIATRTPERYVPSGNLAYVGWDGRSVDALADVIENVQAVVNFAGAPIAGGRWTWRRKRNILDSRVDSTRALVLAMKNAGVRPSVFLSASGVGFYGNGGEEPLTENAPRGSGFLADVCSLWESTAAMAEQVGVRVAILRLGVVLGAGGGMVEKIRIPFALFLGGTLGTGRQWLSWVHIEDVEAAITEILSRPDMQGIMNMVSPGAVTFQEFTDTVGHVLRRPSFFRVPGPVLKLILGDLAEEMLLVSQKAIPAVLQRSGYAFKHPALKPALQEALGCKQM